jgi:hypothetical protein
VRTRKKSGWKEDNHIKDVDQTSKIMIIGGSRYGGRGVKHHTDID